VNHDGWITPADALAQVNAINAGTQGVYPIDVLRCINYINQYGTETRSDFPIGAAVPVPSPMPGESVVLGRIAYSAARPITETVDIVLTRTNTSTDINDIRLVDQDGFETLPTSVEKIHSLLLFRFTVPLVGSGELTVRGRVTSGPATVVCWAPAWDAVRDVTTIAGFELSRVVA
jgi:hypothetical protein